MRGYSDARVRKLLGAGPQVRVRKMGNHYFADLDNGRVYQGETLSGVREAVFEGVGSSAGPLPPSLTNYSVKWLVRDYLKFSLIL